jgi:predicted XRE-type DNA-binding protein
LNEFPEPEQDYIGYALYIPQRGGNHRDTKALSRFGWLGRVDSATTPARGGTDRQGEGNMSKKGYETGSRNVFKDIGVPNAEEHPVKAQLVFKIDTIMKERRLKRVEATALFGVRQPDVSVMLRGELRQFSVERLLRFLVALDQDVEIVGKPHQGRNSAPALHVS